MANPLGGPLNRQKQAQSFTAMEETIIFDSGIPKKKGKQKRCRNTKSLVKGKKASGIKRH